MRKIFSAAMESEAETAAFRVTESRERHRSLFLSYFSIAVIKHHDQKQHGEEMIYLILQLHITVYH